MTGVEPEDYPGGPDRPQRDAARPAALAAAIGVGVALVSLPLAALAGGPYLSIDRVNPWIVVFAAGLFAALFASAFIVERVMRGSRSAADEHWERPLLVWGGVAVVVLVVALLVGVAGDFSTSSLAGSVGLIAGAEAALVLGTLLVLLLSS